MANLPLETVKKLYYGEELSVQEVSEKLGTTPSVVFKFMRRMELPRRNLHQINRRKFEQSPLSFNIRESLTEEERQLKITGIMLYWAEGTKTGHSVDFANSDPDMIRIFLSFLREICGVDEKRLRVYLYCHIDQRIEELRQYWTEITRIPLLQFTKPYIRQDSEKKKGREMKYGLIHVRYSDKRLLLQIGEWIKEYIEQGVGTEAVKPVTL